MDKKRFVSDSLFRAFGMFTFLCPAMLGVASLYNEAVVGLSIEKMAVILAFSLCFGFSFFVFDIGVASATTKRMLHVILTTLLWVPAFILMGSVGEGKSRLVMGIIIACLIMLVMYPLFCLFAKLWNKLMSR